MIVCVVDPLLAYHYHFGSEHYKLTPCAYRHIGLCMAPVCDGDVFDKLIDMCGVSRVANRYDREEFERMLKAVVDL